jgi:hypothetical protein
VGAENGESKQAQGTIGADDKCNDNKKMQGELTALIRDLEGLAHRTKLPQQASIAVSSGRTLSLVSSDGILLSA